MTALLIDYHTTSWVNLLNQTQTDFSIVHYVTIILTVIQHANSIQIPSHWHRVTAVVSCGQVRVFAFRPIPEISVWNDWDIIYQNAKQQKDDTTCAPATLSLFPGDVVLMTRDCNDCFHHAVYSSQSSLSNHLDSSRVSLVFKRAIDRNGKRGHGLEGEGRRSRRNLVV